MMSASTAVRTAIVSALANDVAVTAALGGARIYDDVPTRAEFPYLVFAQTSERDWSTATDVGHEHLVTLHVWSRALGRKETDAIMAATQAALHDQALALDGHRLVNLRHEFSDARRDPDGETYHGITRYRAVTEPM
ncbi:MAG: hypothetical protein CTY31_08030 [Hyphomicrobium sp.]|nr:MAG: hypothetical protein CTY39_08155 [Hyphomicrobium sp.]PPC99837.1 MAG: hypothetical protein CTY31_08030 [Hyphomicrobium sp.]